MNYVIADTNDFLDKIKRVRPPPGGGHLAVIDAKKLYPSIDQPHLKATLIKAVRTFVADFNKGTVIIELLVIVFDHQTVSFANELFHIILGIATGMSAGVSGEHLSGSNGPQSGGAGRRVAAPAPSA